MVNVTVLKKGQNCGNGLIEAHKLTGPRFCMCTNNWGNDKNSIPEVWIIMDKKCPKCGSYFWCEPSDTLHPIDENWSVEPEVKRPQVYKIRREFISLKRLKEINQDTLVYPGSDVSMLYRIKGNDVLEMQRLKDVNCFEVYNTESWVLAARNGEYCSCGRLKDVHDFNYRTGKREAACPVCDFYNDDVD